jgi:acyl carrier protein
VKLAQLFYDRLPETELHNLYGPTEAAVDVTAWNCKQEVIGNGVPIGRPIANTSIYILDVYGQPAPIGVAGELYIGGVQVGRGYLNRPELTPERFLPDRFSGEPGGRMYKTGDLCRWLSEGVIEYLGRTDYQVKIRGFRIELGEIEAHLGGYPGVREVVALAREESGADKRLIAYLVCEGERAPSVEDLRGYLKKRLPEYMQPARFVWLEQMPLLPNGKVDRRALSAPEVSWSEEGESYAPPRTLVEEALVEIFQEALKLDRVGINDNFFELGGHSLLATQVVSRVNDAFEIELEVKTIFEARTVAQLAAALTAQEQKPGRMEMIAMILKKLNGMTDEDAGAELRLRMRQERMQGPKETINERFPQA